MACSVQCKKKKKKFGSGLYALVPILTFYKLATLLR